MPRSFNTFYPALYEDWMEAEGVGYAGGRDFLQYAEGTWQGDTHTSLGGPLHYDPMLIYHLVKEYTGDSDWDEVIEAAKYQWFTLFLEKSAGSTQAYHAMSGGLRKHYEATGDIESGEMVAMMHRLSGAADSYSLTYLSGWPKSRDASFATIVHLDAESIGCASRPKRAALKTIMFGHIDQWTDPENAEWPVGLYGPNCVAVQCFMMGLTLKSLCEYWDRYRDSDIPAKVKQAIDWLWNNAWNLNSNFGFPGSYFKDPNAQAFPYWDRNTNRLRDERGCGGSNNSLGYDGGFQPQPAPALNPLIAHAFVFYALHWATAAERPVYLDRFEVISAGATKPFQQKEYNQAHLYSIVALRQREEIVDPPGLATSFHVDEPVEAENRPNALSGTFKVELRPVGSRVPNPVTIAMNDNGAGGTFLPASLILTTDHPVGRFRYAPAPASAGSVVALSFTNNGGLGGPPMHPVMFAVSSTIAPFATGTEIIPPAWLPGAQGWSGNFTVRLRPHSESNPPVLPRAYDPYFSLIRGQFDPPFASRSGGQTLQAGQIGTWVSPTHQGSFQTWIPAGRTAPFTVKFTNPDPVYRPFGSSVLFSMASTGSSVGTASGTSGVLGAGSRIAAVEGVGTASGKAVVSGIAAGGQWGAGSAAGTSTAEAVGAGNAPEPSGVWHDPTRTVIRSLVTPDGQPEADPDLTTLRIA